MLHRLRGLLSLTRILVRFLEFSLSPDYVHLCSIVHLVQQMDSLKKPMEPSVVSSWILILDRSEIVPISEDTGGYFRFMMPLPLVSCIQGNLHNCLLRCCRNPTDRLGDPPVCPLFFPCFQSLWLSFSHGCLATLCHKRPPLLSTR